MKKMLITLLVLIITSPLALSAPRDTSPLVYKTPQLPQTATVLVKTIFVSHAGTVPITKNVTVKVLGCAPKEYVMVEFMGIVGYVPAFHTSAYYDYLYVCPRAI